jgi:DNA-binding NtrC family response regulator
MNKRILIVDDEANVRLNYRMTLEWEDYEIVEARSGEQALKVLSEHPFDLAILDLRLPGMDGLELLAKMHETGIRVPAMFVTACGDEPYADRAMKLGAIDFVQKPIRPEDFRKIVAEMIRRHAPPDESPAETYSPHIGSRTEPLNLGDKSNP